MQSACALLLSVVCLVLPDFSTLSMKRRDFRKNRVLNIKCVFLVFLQLVPEIFLILRRIQQDILCLRLHVKYPLCLSDFNKT
jgi:hypothetical protein